MPAALPGHQSDWQDVLDYVAWARAFHFTPDQVDNLPIKFFNLALEINGLISARSNGVSFTEAEPGWFEIDLNKVG